jgi:AcrR family transcriptional regulator
MDKREEKTLEKIYEAFRELILAKKYGDISIQEILEKAHISRSTFYAHFKKKEDVLSSVCSTIFDHVFSNSLKKEKDHDFSSSSVFDYKHYLTHIFYHFQEEKSLINGILSSEGKEIFLSDLRPHIRQLMKASVEAHQLGRKGIPEDLEIHQLTEAYIGMVSYWVKKGCLESPETMTAYFEKLYA